MRESVHWFHFISWRLNDIVCNNNHNNIIIVISILWRFCSNADITFLGSVIVGVPSRACRTLGEVIVSSICLYLYLNSLSKLYLKTNSVYTYKILLIMNQKLNFSIAYRRDEPMIMMMMTVESSLWWYLLDYQ